MCHQNTKKNSQLYIIHTRVFIYVSWTCIYDRTHDFGRVIENVVWIFKFKIHISDIWSIVRFPPEKSIFMQKTSRKSARIVCLLLCYSTRYFRIVDKSDSDSVQSVFLCGIATINSRWNVRYRCSSLLERNT